MRILQPVVDLVESNLLAATVLFVLALVLLSIRFLRQVDRWHREQIAGTGPRAAFFGGIGRVVRDPGIALPTGLMLVLSTAMVRVYVSLLFSPGPPAVENLAAAPPTNPTAQIESAVAPPEPPPASKPMAPASAPADPQSQCSTFSTVTYNRNGDCFDLAARPGVVTLVPLDDEIEGTPRATVLAIRVLVDGTAETVLAVTPSDEPRFTILAMEFAKAIRYVPAKKGGKAVAAWTQQVFSPRTR
jgi:hypothetical protein